MASKTALSHADCDRINEAFEKGRVCKNPNNIKRGEIYIADLGMGIGSEQRGIRPVLIIQNDIGNHFGNTVLVVPISSSNKREMTTHLSLSKGTGGLAKDSTLIVEQMRTVDKGRLRNRIGLLSADIMSKVNAKIMIQTGII